MSTRMSKDGETWDIAAIDTVVNLWTPEVDAIRPDRDAQMPASLAVGEEWRLPYKGEEPTYRADPELPTCPIGRAPVPGQDLAVDAPLGRTIPRLEALKVQASPGKAAFQHLLFPHAVGQHPVVLGKGFQCSNLFFQLP